MLGKHAINYYNKLLFNPVFVGEAFDPKDITRANKTKGHRKVHNSAQLNKPKQLNVIQ